MEKQSGSITTKNKVGLLEASKTVGGRFWPLLCNRCKKRIMDKAEKIGLRDDREPTLWQRARMMSVKRCEKCTQKIIQEVRR